jgi:hypothetical protein
MPETSSFSGTSTIWADHIPILWIHPASRHPAPRLVIWLNGLTGTKEQMLPYLEDLAAAGFIALSFDAWGHGERGTEAPQELATRVFSNFRRAMWPILGQTTLDTLRVVDMFYQPGHPFGFISSIYLAEVAICQPLWDAEGIISKLKSRVRPYPDSLQKALVQKFAWEINFSLDIARKSAERLDVTYAAGCCFRSLMCMLQVLFAINRVYWLNEKGAVALADNFPQKPERLRSRIDETFRSLEVKPQSIQKAIVHLDELSKDIEALAGKIS